MILSGIDICSCRDVIEKATEIYINLAPNAFRFLVQSALGITRVVHENAIQQSLGVSRTFAPISQYKDFVEIILVMATEVAERLKAQKLMAKTMTLEAKTVKFDIRQRSCTYHVFIHSKKDIVDEAMKLFKDLWPLEDPCRMLGIRFNNIRSQPAAAKPLTTTPPAANAAAAGEPTKTTTLANSPSTKASSQHLEKEQKNREE